MKVSSIEELLTEFRVRYGSNALVLYADSDEDPYGTSFMLQGIPATFSVITRDGTLPDGQYDIQIESYPPGDYIFTSIVSLEKFLQLVHLMVGPPERWPT